jgi:hypothetical protein
MRCAREACARWVPDFLVQRRGRGLVFDDGWYCSRPCLEAETRDRLEDAPEPEGTFAVGQNVSRLGALLIHRRLVTQAVLDEALRRQAESGRRLGAELVSMVALTPLVLLRTLATQSRSGYLAAVDPARVTAGISGLSRDVVTALGVVPIEADPSRNRLVVACAAPLPRPSLAVLRALVHPVAIEPLLVTDDIAASLLEAYGTAPAQAKTRVTRVGSMGDAVEQIARAIESGRALRVQPVRCHSWLWIRLEGGEAPEEIVIPSRLSRGLERRALAVGGSAARKDASWQAAPTAH